MTMANTENTREKKTMRKRARPLRGGSGAVTEEAREKQIRNMQPIQWGRATNRLPSPQVPIPTSEEPELRLPASRWLNFKMKHSACCSPLTGGKWEGSVSAQCSSDQLQRKDTALHVGGARPQAALQPPPHGPLARSPALTLRQLHIVHRGQEHVSMQLLLFWGPFHCQLKQLQRNDVMIIYKTK